MIPTDKPEKASSQDQDRDGVDDSTRDAETIVDHVRSSALSEEADNQQSRRTSKPDDITRRLWQSLNSSHSVNVLLMIFTFGLLLVSAQQCSYIGKANRVAKRAANAAERAAKAAEDSVLLTERSLQITQKAFVLVTTPPQLSAQIQPLAAVIQVTNGGQTSAREVKIWAKVKVVKAGDNWPDFAKEQDPVPNNPTHYTVASHQIFSVTYNLKDKLSAEMSTLLKTHSADILVFGQISFDDEFSVHHNVKFCTNYSFNEQLVTDVVSICPYWNETI